MFKSYSFNLFNLTKLKINTVFFLKLARKLVSRNWQAIAIEATNFFKPKKGNDAYFLRLHS